MGPVSYTHLDVYKRQTFNTYLSNPTYNPFMDETLYGTYSSQLKEEVPTIQPLQLDANDGDNLVDEMCIRDRWCCV